MSGEKERTAIDNDVLRHAENRISHYCTRPRRRVKKPSALSSVVRSRGGSSPVHRLLIITNLSLANTKPVCIQYITCRGYPSHPDQPKQSSWPEKEMRLRNHVDLAALPIQGCDSPGPCERQSAWDQAKCAFRVMGDIAYLHLRQYALPVAFDLRLCGGGRSRIGVLENVAENEPGHSSRLGRFLNAIDA